MPIRRFLLLWLLLWAALAPAQDQRRLTILHTNDLHARLLPDGNGQGGFARVAAAVRRERAGCNSCLLLNGGDLVQGSPVSTLYRGVPIYQVANSLGIDVSTVGNHEFDYGWRLIPEFLRVARFPTVSANLQDEKGRLLVRRPHVILQVNGLRVAVIGALTADLAELTMPETTGPWRALPVVEALRPRVRELRDRSDLIVLLAHISNREEDEVLSRLPEVSVVVSGHVHRGLESPKKVGDRLAVRVRAYGVELGRLDLTVDLRSKTVVESQWRRIPIDAAIPPANDVARLVQRWEGRVSRVVDVPIGEAVRDIAGADLKRLMEQSMAEGVGAELAFMNQGGIRDFFPKGRLLARHVWNVMPFDNRVVKGRFRGRELPAAVTQGRQIDPDREYTLAVNDFTAAHQQAEMGSSGHAFPEVGRRQRDLLLEWIRKKKVLD